MPFSRIFAVPQGSSEPDPVSERIRRGHRHAPLAACVGRRPGPGPAWYTAQRSGQLGRLDPGTGKADLIPLGPGAAPHGVIIGPDGAPWITEGGTNAIVRVDPQTRDVKRGPRPEARGYVNLNTPTFDRRGRIWFPG